MAKQQSEQWLQELIEEYGAAIARTARLYERNPGERQDLVQDIWLAVWRSSPAFRGQSSLRTYLFRIAHNCGVDHCARDARRARPTPQTHDSADPAASPDTAAIQHQNAARLQRALRQLPLQDRQVVSLKLEGLSNREIAETTGSNENNVAVRLTRARGKLQGMLESDG